MKAWNRAAVVLLLAALAGPLDAEKRSGLDLLNLSLSPELASWLVGPISRLADEKEIDGYLKLTSETDALAFIEAFWQRRDPDPDRPGNPFREMVAARAVEADRRFAEGGVAGRRTDRGTTFVLYGEPKTIKFEPSPLYGEPPLEHWSYPANSPVGLDSEKPEKLYRFVKRGDLTVFYVAGRPGRFSDRPPGARGSGR